MHGVDATSQIFGGPARRADDLLLARLRRGELTTAMIIRGARTPDVIRIAHSSGHHCVIIDLEHCAMSLDVATTLAAAAFQMDMTPIVRVPEREYGMIGRVLDGGAIGIVAPRIETAAEARTVARACRFPPRGQRSQIGMVPHYGLRPVPAKHLNPALDDLAVVQILVETPAGIANVDAIAAVEGVDMVVIGVNDLTAELGVPGDFRDRRVRDSIVAASDACKAHGKVLSVGGISDLSYLAELLPLGVAPLIYTGTDNDLLMRAATDRQAQVADWFRALASAPDLHQA